MSFSFSCSRSRSLVLTSFFMKMCPINGICKLLHYNSVFFIYPSIQLASQPSIHLFIVVLYSFFFFFVSILENILIKFYIKMMVVGWGWLVFCWLSRWRFNFWNFLTFSYGSCGSSLLSIWSASEGVGVRVVSEKSYFFCFSWKRQET